MFIEIPANKRSLANRKPIYGIATNDADYFTFRKVNGEILNCPYYVKWKGILNRCYSNVTQKNQPAYIGCSVCDEWLTFSAFKAWMIKQDWQGKEIDKDLIIQGNKVYSPDTCLFVLKEINTLLTDSRSTRGDLPQGVAKKKSNGKYVAQCCLNGERAYLGIYKTPELASEAYKKFKYAIIKEVALKQLEPLRSALLNYEIR